jgi:hypothetical protein|tara:strand:+ start:2171 stop:2797 length:627 start_codon:yes stop_codon:yes gene_type:complete
MSTIINADTSAGLKLTSDTSGEIKLQSAGADIATVSSTGIAMASGKTLTGDALSNGKILQVIQNQKTDTFSSTTVLTSTVEVTGGNATITPSSSSSKVLVMISGAFGVSPANYGVALQLKRGTTLISMGDLRGSETRAAAGSPVKGTGWAENFAITFLDSPSTTSATTYKLFLGVESGATAMIGGSYASAGTYNMSIPTNIVLMEVAA